ncbi:MAG: DUF3578 domain-containing protein [Firmicutes bacterium HGW-Firmicutes-9]|jgi:hypothetical protein|nr:MAG: DUF3578 domain-containing protein [Firmicutes bacterium HGW-Firmicutes-9]
MILKEDSNLKDIFAEVLQNYVTESKQDLAKNSHARFIRDNIPAKIFSVLQLNSNQFKIQASPGQGRWTEVPWIGIFDRDITETATRGYFIVYLFRADMSGVYLSLNQGWTSIKLKFGAKEGRVNLQKLTRGWQKILSSTLNDFSFDQIDLKAIGENTNLPEGYEMGHICGKYYDANMLPDNHVIIDDLRSMLSVYRELKGKMHDLSTEKTNDFILAGDQTGIFDIDEKDDELNHLIITPFGSSLELQDSPAVFHKPKQSDGRGHKVNHIKKQINDMRIGLAGEKMVIEYEKKRLIDEGRDDLVAIIEHTSQEKGDGTGYDILSFDKNGNRKYIEVKTTVGGEDTPFFITDNELQFSILNSDNYTLYRLYEFNAKKRTASFYILEGDMTQAIKFKATTYLTDEFI